MYKYYSMGINTFSMTDVSLNVRYSPVVNDEKRLP